MRLENMTPDTLPAALAVNRHYEELLSPLTLEELKALVRAACYAKQTEGGAAFLIAFDQDGIYDSENFQWFKARYERFVYVDRIAIDEALQGRSVGRAFYDDLIAFSSARGAGVLCAEVNNLPPNPGSHAFHRKMEFNAMGAARVGSKEVEYYVREL